MSRHRPPWGSLPAAAVAILAVAGLRAVMSRGAPAGSAPQAPYQFQGEYGLAVSVLGDSLAVHWLTQDTDSGDFEAYVGRQRIYAHRTPEAKAHVAVFRRPRRGLVTLIYGGVRNATDRETTTVSLDQPSRPNAVIRGVDSVFVLSDVHGHFNSLIQVLARASVIDDALHWKAGHAHLVFVGDLIDRGDDATRVLWLVYRLEREARAAGGAVDVVLGNHEIMEWVGDRRYLAPKESLIVDYYHTCYACLYDLRSSILGQWLASKPGILQVNDLVFAHGGITPRYAVLGTAGFNDALYRYLREPIFAHLLEDSAIVSRFGVALYQRRFGFFFFPDSPFWFRGYVQSDTFPAQLDSVLARLGAKVHVVGHTPVPLITATYGGKLFPVNVIDFATQLVRFTYSRDGKGRALRIDIEGKTEELK